MSDPQITEGESTSGSQNTKDVASKLPAEYDTALLGATVSRHAAAQFAYSLKALTKLVIKERECLKPEARQIIYQELIVPFGSEIAFIDDTLLVVEEPAPVSKIIIPTQIGKRRWQ